MAAAICSSLAPSRSSLLGNEYQVLPFMAPKYRVAWSADRVIGLTATLAGLPWNWIGTPPMTILASGSACSAA
ncbi:hypothetical protein N5F07_04565 [Pseudomonas chengduensis]|nr:hypothetical protein [Pseudomonas chengduensis]MDH1620425.1 hypothetical protein [Pseudomonas chengduensis]MDH1866951.1 hypothetical protein [Pseudomonas chengduensis]